MSNKIKIQAFSLVELAIVLVILGLLVGGVLSGKSLIRASELRSISTQYNSYYSATAAFRDKYFALPGDMTNATSFWGEATPCGFTYTGDQRTCNGNGDNKMGLFLEDGRYWQQLANAALIEGAYCGVRAGDCPANSLPPTPSGKLQNAKWIVADLSSKTATVGWFDGEYNNSLIYSVPNINYNAYGAIVTPEDIWNIDNKMDDGKPATGKLVAHSSGGLSVCTTAAGTTAAQAASLTADYLLTETTTTCAIIFRQQF